MKEIQTAQIIIPTLNAERVIQGLLDSIKDQINVNLKILIIDSESDDSTVELAEEYGCQVISIKRQDFNHGGTRQLGVDLCPDKEFVVFLTQDAILADKHAIENILKCFSDEKVGCAYGRQVPHKNANLLATHARLFNYPKTSQVKTKNDLGRLGIKTVFISDSFAAYRRKALNQIGGFPCNVLLSEDMYVAAKMILRNWKNYYCAEAIVYHSHNYSIRQELKRYYDIGVFHAKEKWIREKFGETQGEGVRFLLSEIKYVVGKARVEKIFLVVILNFLKYLAYKFGNKK